MPTSRNVSSCGAVSRAGGLGIVGGDYAGTIGGSGALLLCQVQCMADIELALRAGAAGVVVQGTEAGGHGASRSIFPFLPETADYLKQHSPETLLLAAGGIADGRGLAAALILGADGVVVGTRFWASAESLAKEAHTDLAIAANGDSTVWTRHSRHSEASLGRDSIRFVF